MNEPGVFTDLVSGPESGSDADESLAQALDRARGELHLQQEFLAIVAHELRNPIAPIALGIETLLAHAEKGPVDHALLLRRLQMLDRHVRALRLDLDRLLDFSRIRTGRLDLVLDDVDLTAIVHETLRDMRAQLAASHCEVRLQLAEDVHGRWDATRVRQVVWNLVSNAAKYAPRAPIDITLRADDRNAQLVVADHGPGIPPSEHERVFHRFERATANRPHTGFGVGLWLVRHIVEALGGRIRLDSEAGAGATFTIILPRMPEG